MSGPILSFFKGLERLFRAVVTAKPVPSLLVLAPGSSPWMSVVAASRVHDKNLILILGQARRGVYHFQLGFECFQGDAAPFPSSPYRQRFIPANPGSTAASVANGDGRAGPRQGAGCGFSRGGRRNASSVSGPSPWHATFIFRGPLPPERVANADCVRSEGRPQEKRLARRKRLGKPGIMAVDVARVGSGIGIRLAPHSPFCKELSTGRDFMKIEARLRLSRIGPQGVRKDARLPMELGARAAAGEIGGVGRGRRPRLGRASTRPYRAPKTHRHGPHGPVVRGDDGGAQREPVSCQWSWRSGCWRRGRWSLTLSKAV